MPEASTIPFPASTSGFSAGHQMYPYRKYDLRVRYFWDAGTLQLPVAYQTGAAQAAAPPPGSQAYPQRTPSAIIQAAAAYGWKVVTFDIIRIGMEPVIPDPTPTNPNEILRRAEVEPRAAILGADGSVYTYSVNGIYVYSLVRPYWTNDGYRGGSTPADLSQPSQNILTTPNFSQALI